MTNIVCKKWFLFQVEIKKKCYINCCLCPSNGHRRQTKPDQCNYLLMTYLSSDQFFFIDLEGKNVSKFLDK